MFNVPTSSLPTITILSFLHAHRVTNTTALLTTGLACPLCPSCHKHDGNITCHRPTRSSCLSCHKHDDNVTCCRSACSSCPSCHSSPSCPPIMSHLSLMSVVSQTQQQRHPSPSHLPIAPVMSPTWWCIACRCPTPPSCLSCHT